MTVLIVVACVVTTVVVMAVLGVILHRLPAKREEGYTERLALDLKISQEERQLEFIKQQNLHSMAFHKILEQNVGVNRVTQDLTRRLVEHWTASDSIMSAKLNQIHTLVNSNMTAAMESEMEARRLNLLLMQEAVELGRRLGHEPSGEALSGITVAKGKITELQARLRDRVGQAEVADAEMALEMGREPGGAEKKPAEIRIKPG